MYLNPKEAAALSIAIRCGDMPTIDRYNALIARRKTERVAETVREEAAAAARVKEVREAKRQKRNKALSMAAFFGVAIALIVGCYLVYKSQHSAEPSQPPSRHGDSLRTSGPCDTSRDLNIEPGKTLDRMTIGQTGWVTYWTATRDAEGDWIDTTGLESDGGGGTANVCVRRNSDGYEVWVGSDQLTGNRNDTSNPPPHWVHATIHDGQK